MMLALALCQSARFGGAGFGPPSPPGGAPIQYIVPGMNGMPPMYVNESSTANLQYITPAGYVNEAS